MNVESGATSSWIFDTDGHVIEPEEIWTDLPAEFSDYAPQRVVYPDGGSRRVIGTRVGAMSRIVRPSSPNDQSFDQRRGPKGGQDPAARLPDMDLDAIEFAALFPTIGLVIHAVSERRPQLAMCQVVNNWIGAYSARFPDRLASVATLPGNPEDAVIEARRCVEELGFCGVWRRPEMCDGLPALHSPDYESLWAYLEKANVPFFIHPGFNGLVPQDFFTTRFPGNHLACHATHFPVEQMMAMTSFICYGILERHPKLRVGFLETGGGWALYFLNRLDEHIATNMNHQTLPLEHSASYYFRRQCLVSVEDAEPGLAELVTKYPENIAFASDYPHSDGTFPGSTTALLETTSLTEAQRRSVLRDNARQFLFT